MSHSPPIPPGNLTPYPIAEPPHSPASEVTLPVPVKPVDRGVLADLRDQFSPVILGAVAAAAAATAGVVALVALGESKRKGRKASAARPAATRKAAVRKTSSTPKTSITPRTKKASDPVARSAKRARRSSSDDKSDRGPQDAARIGMSEDYEVRYWTKKFGVTRDELQTAVNAVGDSAAAVERQLKL